MRLLAPPHSLADGFADGLSEPDRHGVTSLDVLLRYASREPPSIRELLQSRILGDAEWAEFLGVAEHGGLAVRPSGECRGWAVPRQAPEEPAPAAPRGMRPAKGLGVQACG